MNYHFIVKAFPFFCLPLGCIAQNQRESSPNILLINIDDLGWTDLSCNGSKFYETPNIDLLRKSGIWFNQAYAGAANSAPSRACMLTGMNTPRHGIYTVANSDRGKAEDRKLIPIPNKTALSEGIQILPQVLHDAGYQTFHIGKWHVTADPKECGIDVNIGGCSFGHPKTYFSPYGNPYLSDGEKGEYLPDRLGKEAVSLIKKADPNRPFFLYYATYAVHTPLQARSDLINKYKNKTVTQAHNNPVYAALLESTDRNIGRILKAIKESGREKNTLIIFTTDNGGVYDISKQWPLRAGKGSFYEGGIRVPLIIYQKDKFEQKEINHTAVSQLDLFPTLIELCGIKNKSLLLDGKSLVSLLTKGNDKKLSERPLIWHFPAYLERGNVETKDSIFRTRPVTVIRKGDWKLIKNYEDSTFELYNLSEDIGEKNDLSKKYPQRIKELSLIMGQWIQKTHAPIPTQLNPKYREK